MEHSYHGDTIGAMSVGARGVFNRAYEPLLFDVGTMPFPAPGASRRRSTRSKRPCRAEAPAAFIVEPLILGAGGMLIYPPEVLAEMRAICARHGVLFIADEVMTGWGRTGTLLACEQAGIVPDILCLSKGLTGGALPLAVTLATPAIFEAHLFDRPREDVLPFVELHRQPDRLRRRQCQSRDLARRAGAGRASPTLATRQAERLARLSDGCRASRNPRQIGTITALEIGECRRHGYLSDARPGLLGFFRERDLLLRPLGNTVYVMPPYCIDDDDLDAIYAAIGEAAARFC